MRRLGRSILVIRRSEILADDSWLPYQYDRKGPASPPTPLIREDRHYLGTRDVEVRKLGEICNISPELYSRMPDVERVNYIEISSIDRTIGAIISPRTLPIAALPKRARYVAREGDILLPAIRPGEGAPGVVPTALTGSVISDAIYVLRPKVPTFYLFAFLSTALSQRRLMVLSQGYIPRISRNDAERFPVVVPASDLSNRLAKEVETAWKRASKAVAEESDLLSSRKLSAVLELEPGTGQLSARSFWHSMLSRDLLIESMDPRDYSIIANGESDRLKSMKEIAQVVAGSRLVGGRKGLPRTPTGSPPVVLTSNVGFGIMDWGDVAYATPDLAARTKTVPAGTVLVNLIGPQAGRAAVLDRVAIVGQNLAGLIPMIGDSSWYICGFLNSNEGRSRIERMKRGTTIPHLSLASLLELKLPWQEQQVIARLNRGVQELVERIFAASKEARGSLDSKIASVENTLPLDRLLGGR